MARVIYCNICGKKFDVYDESSGACISTEIGYGSKYDGELVDFDICNECMDELIDKCKISPLLEDHIL